MGAEALATTCCVCDGISTNGKLIYGVFICNNCIESDTEMILCYRCYTCGKLIEIHETELRTGKLLCSACAKSVDTSVGMVANHIDINNLLNPDAVLNPCDLCPQNPKQGGPGDCECVLGSSCSSLK